MNSRAPQATSGPNISNAAGAESTTLAAVSASISNGLLSNPHGRCQYFLAKSIDRTACIPSVRDNESIKWIWMRKTTRSPNGIIAAWGGQYWFPIPLG
uniref:Uncharacterized protein n=1 Tax=Romanomermis culicivorax TaxID=13658 RepID=A0A915I1E8_ROMCU